MSNILPGLIPQLDLTALVAVICKEHEATVLGMSYALEHAMAAGDALAKAKAALVGQHGAWLPWLERLERQGGPSVRMAQNYMRLAENRATLAVANTKQRFAFGTVRGALALIRQRRPRSAASRSKLPSPAGKALKLTRHDVFGWLNTAPVEEGQHLFDSLGSRKVATFIPPTWGMSLAAAGENIDEVTHLHARIAVREAEIHERDRRILELQRQLGPVFGVAKAEASSEKPALDHADGLDIPSHTGLTGDSDMVADPRKEGIPLFLQVQNRKPLTAEQRAKLDEHIKQQQASHRKDWRKPKTMSWEDWDAIQAREQALKEIGVAKAEAPPGKPASGPDADLNLPPFLRREAA